LTGTVIRTRPVPQRTCVGCNTATNKRELVRIVRTPEGSVVADPTGKQPGRGAYVHQQADCWEAALKKGRLEHSLKTKLTPDDLRGLRDFAGAAAEESA
jgi:predicted RNA-binding protein YlxR (DUF448 family)